MNDRQHTARTNKRQKREGQAQPRVTRAAATSAVRNQVLRTDLLARVGTFLDVHSLIAATATSRAFQLSLTSPAAWKHSKLSLHHASIEPLVRSPLRLQHLNHLDLQVGSWLSSDDDEIKRLRLPVMRSLLSLHTPSNLTVASLANIPALQTLSLCHMRLTIPLLTALSQQPQLRDLHLRMYGNISVEQYEQTLPLFAAAHIRVHLDTTSSGFPRDADEMARFVPVSRYFHAVTLGIYHHRIDKVSDTIAAQLTASAVGPSYLRSLKLTLYSNLYTPVLMAWRYNQSMVRMLGWYRGLDRVEVCAPGSQMNLPEWREEEEMAEIVAHCQSQHINLVLTKGPY